MDINSLEFKYTKHAGSSSALVEGLTHIKILPWLSVVQSVIGSYDITLGRGELQRTGAGGFFIAPAGVQQTIVHHVDSDQGRMHYRWIFLDVTVNGAYPFDSLYDFPTILPNEYKSQMNRLFEKIFDESTELSRYACYCEVLEILRRCATPRSNVQPSVSALTLEYVKANYTKDISVDELAQNANMSSSNFYAVFKKQSGTSPIAYVNGFRLSLASNLLTQTDTPILQISESVGIRDQLYFSKIFKKTYGMTPSQYRKKQR